MESGGQASRLQFNSAKTKEGGSWTDAGDRRGGGLFQQILVPQRQENGVVAWAYGVGTRVGVDILDAIGRAVRQAGRQAVRQTVERAQRVSSDASREKKLQRDIRLQTRKPHNFVRPGC